MVALVDFYWDNLGKEDKWDYGIREIQSYQSERPLVMEIRFRQVFPHEKFLGQMPDKVEDPMSFTKPVAATYDCGDDGYDGEGGRSSNDNRSDSMNPNNEDYQASMDNRSDQMNPNSDAYWSSRGR